MNRPFTLENGETIDLDQIPEGYEVCFVCGVIPHSETGCTHKPIVEDEVQKYLREIHKYNLPDAGNSGTH